MIHPCDKPCGNKTASGYCATTVCINPQYSNIGTAQYGQGVQKRIITNADRIRSMTDEELAELLTAVAKRSAEELCKSLKTVNVDLSNCDFHILHEAHLDWLKSEVQNE